MTTTEAVNKAFDILLGNITSYEMEVAMVKMKCNNNHKKFTSAMEANNMTRMLEDI